MAAPWIKKDPGRPRSVGKARVSTHFEPSNSAEVDFTFCGSKIESLLKVQPKLWRRSEEFSKTERRVGGHRARTADDATDSIRGNAERLRESVRAHAERTQVFLAENLTRMNRTHSVAVHGSLGTEQLYLVRQA